jgi:hypothetical protein
MRNTTADPQPVLDVWPYVSQVPTAELRGARLLDQLVECVYRTANDRCDHVLVMTDKSNVYLVVVVDRPAADVQGHYLLDLNDEYGLSSPLQSP